MSDSEKTQAEQTQPEENGRKSKLRPWIRALALFLAIITVLNIWLSGMIQVRSSNEAYIGEFLELAKSTASSTTDYLQESDFRRAWRVLRHTIGKPKTYDDYDTYASVAIAQEDYDKAQEYMQGCIDTCEGTDAEKALLYLRKGSLEMLCGEENYPAAKECFTSATELDPTLANAWLLRAQLNLEDGDYEAAVSDVSEYKKYGSDSEIMAAIAPLYEAYGDYESAVECYTAAIEDADGYALDNLSSRGSCYIQLYETTRAKEDFRRFLEEGGEDSDGTVNMLLALCCIEDGEYEEALDAFDHALRHGFDAGTYYAQMIPCSYACSRFDKTLEYAERALAEENETAGTYSAQELSQWHMWKGLAMLAESDPEGSAEELKIALELDDSQEDIYYYAAIAEFTCERYEKAAEYFTASAEREESTEECIYNRGVCYLNLDMAEEAAADFQWIADNGENEEYVSMALEVLEELKAATE